MPKKIIIGIVLVLGAAAAGIYYFDPFSNGNGLKLPGVVEIQEVRLGSKVAGRVAKVLAKEGTDAYAGNLLVVFEAPELEAQRDQLKARVAAAEAELERTIKGARPEEKQIAQAAADAAKARFERMLKGWREEEKRQAQSDLESATADYKQAKDELERVADLYRTRSASRAEYDLAVGLHDRTKGRMNAAKAKIDMMQAGNRQEDKDEAKAEWEKAQANADMVYKGNRDEDIDLAKAKLAEAKAKLRETEVSLQEANVIVPKELGTVEIEVVAVRPGDLVPAGQAVVRVLKAEDMWVKVFVPSTRTNKIKVGMEADVKIDSGEHFRGKVQQIANISEFTPRNVQSLDERHFQVFAVKVQIERPGGRFHAGMAAEVMFRGVPSP